MKRFFYTLLQCTWGLPQTLLGLVLFLRCKRKGCSHRVHHGGICTSWNRGGGVSLGLFFFCEAGDRVTAHEYGHTIQSLIFGPLYLLVVGLPSAIWCNLPYFRRYRKRTGTPYSKLYCEGWADRLGQRYGK